AARACNSNSSCPAKSCQGARRPRMSEAAGSVSATRRLLRRLRDIMAGSGTAQERLEQIVRVVASEMVAEVCSAYILRAGEVLQTIAMIVAELAASGNLVNPLEIAQSHGGVALPVRIVGVRLNAGLAIGPAVLHEPRVVIRQVVAEDVDAELGRLRGAVRAM